MSVEYELHDDVAVVTIARPDVFNSIDQSVSDGLVDAMGRVGREARAAVLTGSGRAFCAGADLSDLMGEYETSGPELESVIATRFNPAIEAILACEAPTVAAVNGAAAGAGMGLALACDLRVMAESAFFMSAFINVGLIPDSGSAWMLPQMIGVGRAMEIAMTGRRVPADEAARLGLATAVVDADRVLETAIERAVELASGPRRAYVETRRIIHMAAASSLGTTLDREAVVQGELGSLPTHIEGMKAFVEKRRPDFRGAEISP